MRRTAAGSEAAPESALARLLEVESRLEAMLEEARQAAESTVREARGRAEAHAGTNEAEMAAADAELTALLSAEALRRIAEEQAALARVQSRYEQVDDRGVEAHAAWVLEQVLASVRTEAP